MWRGNPLYYTVLWKSTISYQEILPYTPKAHTPRAPQPPTVKCLTTTYIHPPGRPPKRRPRRRRTHPRWHVAIVNHNAEHTIARTIAARGIPTYVASQPQLRIWRDGRRHHIDHVVIPSTIFIHCTEPQRRTLLQTTPGLHRFLIDRATATRPDSPPSPTNRSNASASCSAPPTPPSNSSPAPSHQASTSPSSADTLRGLHAEIPHHPRRHHPHHHITHHILHHITHPPPHPTLRQHHKHPYPPTARILIRLHQLGCATVAISPSTSSPSPPDPMPSIRSNIILNGLNTITGIIFPIITFPYAARILLPKASASSIFSSQSSII